MNGTEGKVVRRGLPVLALAARRRRLGCAILLAVLAGDLLAASGVAPLRSAVATPSAVESPGEEQPGPTGFRISPSPALSPAEALTTFRLPPGFRMELVASEPLISAPVAIDFDPDGRIWVVEMRGFQNNPDGSNRLDPIGRISVLEDIDGDGRMDRSSVYLDGLILPRAVKVLADGVLIAEPPHLWHTRDRDGDGRADEKEAIVSDFGVKEGNPTRDVSGLIWGMDNWIHSSIYSGQFRLQDGKWIKRPAPVLGDWGVGMDDYGRTYLVTNSGPLRVNLVPSHYKVRNPFVDGYGGVYDAMTTDEEHEVFPIRPNPGVTYGFRPGILRKDGTLVRYTASCGIMIYRGDRLPEELRGNCFLAEPAANLVRRSILSETAGGRLIARNAYHRSEFIASTDERFRPVNFMTAPDGTLYVVDMYRGILEGHPFVTTYLKRQIKERGLQRPLDRGRIYRVVHASLEPGPAPRMSRLKPADLVVCLAHRNGWWRDKAQQMLVERRSPADVPLIRRLAESAEWDVVRLHAYWTLEGLDALTEADVEAALADSSPGVRSAAIRWAEQWVGNEAGGPLASLVFAAADDPDARVRLQAAMTLGEMSDAQREDAMARLLTRHATQPHLVAAVAGGLRGRELEFLQRIAEGEGWTENRPGFEHAVSVLAAAVLSEGTAERVKRLLQWTAVSRRPDWQRLAVLNSVARPLRLSGRVEIPAGLAQAGDGRIRAAAERLQPYLTPATDRRAPQSAADQALYAQGKFQYAINCAPCHHANGTGLPNVGAALAGSPWVLGSDEMLARIVLMGKQGSQTVMPPWSGMLDDRAIAAILTYIRGTWGNDALPVSEQTVRRVRSEVRSGGGLWTEESLRQEAIRLGLKH